MLPFRCFTSSVKAGEEICKVKENWLYILISVVLFIFVVSVQLYLNLFYQESDIFRKNFYKRKDQTKFFLKNLYVLFLLIITVVYPETFDIKIRYYISLSALGLLYLLNLISKDLNSFKYRLFTTAIETFPFVIVFILFCKKTFNGEDTLFVDVLISIIYTSMLVFIVYIYRISRLSNIELINSSEIKPDTEIIENAHTLIYSLDTLSPEDINPLIISLAVSQNLQNKDFNKDELVGFYLGRLAQENIRIRELHLLYCYYLYHKTDAIEVCIKSYVDYRQFHYMSGNYQHKFTCHRFENIITNKLRLQFRENDKRDKLFALRHLENNRRYEQLTNAIQRCSSLLVIFWTNLKKTTVDLSLNDKTVQTIVDLLKVIKKEITVLKAKQKLPGNVSEICRKFFQSVIVDKKMQKILKGTEVSPIPNNYSFEDIADNRYILTMENSHVFFTISKNRQRPGQILECSTETRELLGYYKHELIGMTITKLLVSFAREDYNSNISLLFERMNSEYKRIDFLTVFLNREGFFKLGVARLALLPNLERGIEILKVFWPFQSETSEPDALFIVDKDNGDVIAINEGVEAIFNLTPKMLNTSRTCNMRLFNLNFLLPSVNEDIMDKLINCSNFKMKIHSEIIVQLMDNFFDSKKKDLGYILQQANRYLDSERDDLSGLVNVSTIKLDYLEKKGFILLRVNKPKSIERKKPSQFVQAFSLFPLSEMSNAVQKESTLKIEKWFGKYKNKKLPRQLCLTKICFIIVVSFFMFLLFFTFFAYRITHKSIQDYVYGTLVISRRLQLYIFTNFLMDMAYHKKIKNPAIEAFRGSEQFIKKILIDHTNEHIDFQYQYKMIQQNITGSIGLKTIVNDKGEIYKEEPYQIFNGNLFFQEANNITIKMSIEEFIYYFLSLCRGFLDTYNLEIYPKIKNNYDSFIKENFKILQYYFESELSITQYYLNVLGLIDLIGAICFGIIFLLMFFQLKTINDKLDSLFYSFGNLTDNEIDNRIKQTKHFLNKLENPRKIENQTPFPRKSIALFEKSEISSLVFERQQKRKLSGLKSIVKKKGSYRLLLYLSFGGYTLAYFIIMYFVRSRDTKTLLTKIDFVFKLGNITNNLACFNQKSYDYIYARDSNKEDDSLEAFDAFRKGMDSFNSDTELYNKYLPDNFVKNITLADTNICEYYIKSSENGEEECEGNIMFYQGFRTLANQVVEDLGELKNSINSFPAGYMFNTLLNVFLRIRESLSKLMKEADDTFIESFKDKENELLLIFFVFSIGFIILIFIFWKNFFRKIVVKVEHSLFYVKLFEFEEFEDNEGLKNFFEEIK